MALFFANAPQFSGSATSPAPIAPVPMDLLQGMHQHLATELTPVSREEIHWLDYRGQGGSMETMGEAIQPRDTLIVVGEGGAPPHFSSRAGEFHRLHLTRDFGDIPRDSARLLPVAPGQFRWWENFYRGFVWENPATLPLLLALPGRSRRFGDRFDNLHPALFFALLPCILPLFPRAHPAFFLGEATGEKEHSALTQFLVKNPIPHSLASEAVRPEILEFHPQRRCLTLLLPYVGKFPLAAHWHQLHQLRTPIHLVLECESRAETIPEYLPEYRVFDSVWLSFRETPRTTCESFFPAREKIARFYSGFFLGNRWLERNIIKLQNFNQIVPFLKQTYAWLRWAWHLPGREH